MRSAWMHKHVATMRSFIKHMQIPFSAQRQADLHVIFVRNADYMQLRLGAMQLQFT